MWCVFISRITNISLKELRMWAMVGDVTGDDVMTQLFNSTIISLHCLDLSHNASWWTSSEAFTQLLGFLKRQTHLKSFHFHENDLTTS